MSNEFTEMTFTGAPTNLLNNCGKFSFTVYTRVFSTLWCYGDDDEAAIEIEILQGNKMYITAEFDLPVFASSRSVAYFSNN